MRLRKLREVEDYAEGWDILRRRTIFSAQRKRTFDPRSADHVRFVIISLNFEGEETLTCLTGQGNSTCAWVTRDLDQISTSTQGCVTRDCRFERKNPVYPGPLLSNVMPRTRYLNTKFEARMAAHQDRGDGRAPSLPDRIPGSETLSNAPTPEEFHQEMSSQ